MRVSEIYELNWCWVCELDGFDTTRGRVDELIGEGEIHGLKEVES